MKRWTTLGLIICMVALSSLSYAGGWKSSEGLNKMTVEGELVCLGCSLKKLSGANAECSLYSQHDLGVKLADGTLWTIVNNQKGHDIIKAHGLLERKTATIIGWLYPNAHHIEIDSITVKGVEPSEIAKAALAEDHIIANALLKRKAGQAPEHKGHKH